MTSEDITSYLESTGHTVETTPTSQDGGRTWTCETTIENSRYNTTVYTEGEHIVGHEDTIID